MRGAIANLKSVAAEVNDLKEMVTLGVKGHIPSGYIVSCLRVLKQFTQYKPSG